MLTARRAEAAAARTPIGITHPRQSKSNFHLSRAPRLQPSPPRAVDGQRTRKRIENEFHHPNENEMFYPPTRPTSSEEFSCLRMRWSRGKAALRALPALALSAATAAFTSPPLVSMSAARTAVDERSAAVIAGHWRRDDDISSVQGTLQRRHVDYSDGGCSLRGVAVWPALQAETRKLPGVLVVHTAVGLQEDFMDFVLSKVASMGCLAFGADMYGMGCALWDRDSIRMAGAHLREDRSKMVQRTLAAYEAMRSAPQVDRGTSASIGFCFGGIAVLDLARRC